MEANNRKLLGSTVIFRVIGAVFLGLVLAWTWVGALASRSAFAPVHQTAAYDFSVIIGAIPFTFLPDGNYEYFIAVESPDYTTGAASLIYVEDPLPQGVSWIPVNPENWNCTSFSTPTYVVCLYTDTFTTTFTPLRIPVVLNRVPPGEVAGAIVNTVTVHTLPQDRDLSNNIASIRTLTTDKVIDLSISKSVSPETIDFGEISYTLTYSNTEPYTATQVLITDTLPAELTFITSQPPPDRESPDRKTLVWESDDLPFDAGNQTIVITASVPISATGMLLTNQARISGDETDLIINNNTASVSIRPDTRSYDFTILKEAIPSVFISNVPTFYRFSVFTLGTSLGTADSVRIEDELPHGVTWTPVNTPYWECLESSTLTRVSCRYRIPNAATFEALTIQVVLDRRPYPIGVADQITNQATVVSVPSDREITNNTATLTTITHSSNAYDFSITKTAIPSVFLPGTTAMYQFSVTASSYLPGAASAIYIDDILPTGVSWTPTDTSAWECLSLSTPDRVTCFYANTQDIIFTPLRIRVELDREPPGNVADQLVNEATVHTIPEDRDTGNNTAVLTTLTTDQIADLSLRNTVTPTIIDSGLITYTLTYSNTSNIAAIGAFITDTLPAELEFVAADPAATIISADRKQLRWDFADPIHSTDGIRKITITAHVVEGLTGIVLTNHARISSTTLDLNQANNAASSIVQPGYLSILKASAWEGQTLTSRAAVEYTITVHNPTANRFHSLIVSDTLHPALDFLAGTFGLVFDPGSRTVRYTASYFPGNTTSSFRFRARVNSSFKDPILIPNQAMVSWLIDDRRITVASNTVEVTGEPLVLIRHFFPLLFRPR